jgi:hypothetical protein
MLDWLAGVNCHTPLHASMALEDTVFASLEGGRQGAPEEKNPEGYLP